VQNTLSDTDKNVPTICVTSIHFNYMVLLFLSSLCFINLLTQNILILLQNSKVQYDIIVKMLIEKYLKFFCHANPKFSPYVSRGLARPRLTTLLPPYSKVKPEAINAVVSS
jgi:hypothetical protein